MKKKILKTIYVLMVILVTMSGMHIFKTTKSAKKNRLVATTMAQVAIFNQLDIPLVAVPTTQDKLPKKYEHLPKVGNHVTANFEQMVAVKPSIVYVDNALKSDYAERLKQQNIKMVSLDFSDYYHLRQSILTLGETYNKRQAAEHLLKSLNLPKQHLQRQVKVLILLGMPGGSFLIANDKSYIGDLVKRAGGKVVAGDPKTYYTIANPQIIAQENPDIVIRLAHGMPEQVKKSFGTIFKQPPYTKMKATMKQQIYDVTTPKFDINANLEVVSAYRQIQDWLESAR